MKNRSVPPGWAIVCLLLSVTDAFADEGTNRYSVIAQKNTFALKAAAAATNASPVVATASLARIKLTGLAVIPPLKWVVLKIQEPGKPAAMTTLQEGCSEGVVEILEVDANARHVKIRNAGLMMTLTFEDEDLLQKKALAGLEVEHRPLPLLPPTDAGDL